MKGGNIEVLAPPEKRAEVHGILQKARQGEHLENYETVRVAKDGRRIDVSLTVSPVVDAAGNVVAAWIMAHDITERKAKERLGKALNEIHADIASTRDFDEIMRRVVGAATEAIGCERGVTYLREDGAWLVRYTYGFPPELIGRRFTDEQAPFATNAADTRKPVVSTDVYCDERVYCELMVEYEIKSLLAVPLIVKDEVLGTMLFTYHSAPTSFAGAEVDFASTLAASASLALENAQSFETVRRARADAERLAELAAYINATLEPDKILDAALGGALSAAGTGHGCIYLIDPATGMLAIEAYEGLNRRFLDKKKVVRPGEGCAGGAAVSKKIFAPTEAERGFVCRESEELLGLDCLAAIPIVARGRALGVLELFSPVARRLSARERALVETIAGQLAAALENAQLYAAQRDVAETLQEALLKVPERLPGVEFGYLYRSATAVAAVGGDFFDLFELGHGRVGIVIGDVLGKGLEAATTTALVKNTIKALAYKSMVPSSVITQTSEVLLKHGPEGMFVTAFFGVLNTGTGVLVYCSAGHPPAMIKRPSKVEFITTGSPVIGVLGGLTYVDQTISLKAGDVLVLYTDGVIEARRDGDLYGEEQLAARVRGIDAGVGEFPQLILDDIVSFSGGRLVDDVALLSVSLAPDTPRTGGE